MKKGKQIFLSVIAVVLFSVCALCVWQWNNVVAVFKMMFITEEQLMMEINTSKKDLEDSLKEKHPTIVSDFSAEEEAQILKGKLSVEQAVDRLKEKYETAKKEAESAKNLKDFANREKIDNLIGDKVIELYSLKAYYLGQLGQMEAKVKAEYIELPKEKKSLVGKQELVNKYMSTVLGLMNQCDEQVSQLLSELETGLKSLNGDTSIVNTIKTAYENEKTLKKAQYLKLLKG